MPIPKGITRFNKHFTNRLFLLFAGRMPPWAVVSHRGRSSGRDYRTPVLAFPTETGFVFALTYGRGVDWARNFCLGRRESGVQGGGDTPVRGEAREVC